MVGQGTMADIHTETHRTRYTQSLLGQLKVTGLDLLVGEILIYCWLTVSSCLCLSEDHGTLSCVGSVSQ